MVSSSQSGYGSTSAAATGSGELTWARRLEIATEIGKFLRRALGGDHRGASGRDQIPLSSRFWIVVRDFEGQVYDPAKVFDRWHSVKGLVKKQGDCGQSVFVGCPSERGVRAVLLGGGFRWEGLVEQ